MPITFAICGCGSRGLEAYASYQKFHPEKMKIVAGVVDGDKPDAVLREGEVSVEPGQCGVPAQPGEVLGDSDSHIPRFNLRQHCLEARAVIGHTTYTVIHEKYRVWKMVVFNVLE